MCSSGFVLGGFWGLLVNKVSLGFSGLLCGSVGTRDGECRIPQARRCFCKVRFTYRKQRACKQAEA